METLNQNTELVLAKAASAAATSAVNSDVIDMANFGGVQFMTYIGTANAGNFIKAQQGDESDLSDAADLEGTKLVATADGEGLWLDITKPSKRYVRIVATRGASTTLGAIWAVKYNPRTGNRDNQETDVLIGEGHVSPAEGTA